MRLGTTFLVGLALSPASLVAQEAACDPGWLPAFGHGSNARSHNDSQVFDDGSGPALYVGVSFDSGGPTGFEGLVKWDGVSVSSVATFTAAGPSIVGVGPLAEFDDGGGPGLYVGGNFITAGGVPADRIAKWDGTTWSALGAGLDQGPIDMVSFDDGSGEKLFVAGAFQTAGGVVSPLVARWDGASWLPASPEPILSAASHMAVHDDGSGPALYAVGTGGLARWDGAGWTAVPAPFSKAWDMLSFDDGTGARLWVGSTTGLWKQDGQGGWTSMQPSDEEVFTLVAWDNGGAPALYAAWRDPGYDEEWGVLRFDRSGVTEIATGLPIWISEMTVFDDGSGERLYASGVRPFVTYYLSETPSKTWIWDGATWEPLEPGFDGRVLELETVAAVSGESLFASGWFLTAASAIAPFLAEWDGAQWNAVADPDVYVLSVNALTAHDDGAGPALHAGGNFRFPGSNWVDVVRMDGSTWTPLGGDLPYGVGVLESFDDGSGAVLYAGIGGFLVGGFKGLRSWDGSAWNVVSGGVETDSGSSERVDALCVWDDGSGPALFVGGRFDRAGGAPAQNVAKWDGTSWSALGAGTDDRVWCFAVWDDGSGQALYAGGSFSNAGGLATPAQGVAKWDGTGWSALGLGLGTALSGERVNALAAFDDGAGPVLFAGGTFATAGGAFLPYLARWDGTAWSPLAGGVENTVHALAVYAGGQRPELLVGGEFLSTIDTEQTLLAGDAYLGRWGQPCDGPVTYCQAKTSSGGCVAGIDSVGTPSLSGPDDFRVTATGVSGQKPGLMFWGTAKAALPFFGGTLCVIPVTRTPIQFSNGSSASSCDGAFDYALTQAYLASFGIGAGTQLFAQYWLRDPGFAPPNNVALSNGLAFTVTLF